ncbi:MAG: hypothetical protein FWG66_05840 [Spirochaetes bacterium]|nr:hypothetical protein [Spirochaetota bacterium]
MSGRLKSGQSGRSLYEGLFSARALCLCGLLVMPAVLFNPVLPFRAAQFLFFWLLCRLCGKKNNVLVTLSVILGITAFNLLVPHGLVLFSIGAFNVTQGALFAGLHRAVTFQSLLMISRLSIRRDLKIPGGFGELVGESFRIFSGIMNSRGSVSRKNFMADIDRLLISLSDGSAAQESSGDEPPPAEKTSPAGFAILAAIAALSWLPLFVLLAG